jgi:hypothetical protein
MRSFIMFVTGVFLSASAFADQCAWNKLTDARSAQRLLKGNDAIFWCQNCNEKPSKIFRIVDVKVARGTGELTATVQGRSEKLNLDLAYTYVRTASDIFANVAHLVGCPSEGAMTFVKTGPGAKKEAHYYDQHGSKQVLSTALNEDIRPWVSLTKKTEDETRLPASKK